MVAFFVVESVGYHGSGTAGSESVGVLFLMLIVGILYRRSGCPVVMMAA